MCRKKARKAKRTFDRRWEATMRTRRMRVRRTVLSNIEEFKDCGKRGHTPTIQSQTNKDGSLPPASINFTRVPFTGHGESKLKFRKLQTTELEFIVLS